MAGGRLNLHCGLEIRGLEILFQRIDELIQIAVEDSVEIICGEIDPMISNTALRKIVCPYSFRTLAGPDLTSARFILFLFGLVLLHFQDLGTQDLHGLGPILVLRFLILTGNDNTSGYVCNADS